MTTILQILTSPRPHSFSHRIARDVTARLVALHPRAEIIERVFATIGIRQVNFLCADGLSRVPESIERVLAHAKAWIDEHLPL